MIKGDRLTQARFELNAYTKKVLDVVKGRHGLKNRNEALRHFVHEYGQDYAEFRIGPQTMREIDRTFKEHIQKHPNRRMTDKQLRKLLGIEDVEL